MLLSLIAVCILKKRCYSTTEFKPSVNQTHREGASTPNIRNLNTALDIKHDRAEQKRVLTATPHPVIYLPPHAQPCLIHDARSLSSNRSNKSLHLLPPFFSYFTTCLCLNTWPWFYVSVVLAALLLGPLPPWTQPPFSPFYTAAQCDHACFTMCVDVQRRVKVVQHSVLFVTHKLEFWKQLPFLAKKKNNQVFANHINNIQFGSFWPSQ